MSDTTPTARIVVARRGNEYVVSWRRLRADGRPAGRPRSTYRIGAWTGGIASVQQRVAGLRVALRGRGHVVEIVDASGELSPSLGALPPSRPGAPATGETREPCRRLPVDVRESLLADVDAVAGFLGLSRQALVEQSLHAEVHRMRLCPICDTGSPAIEWARAGGCPECREG